MRHAELVAGFAAGLLTTGLLGGCGSAAEEPPTTPSAAVAPTSTGVTPGPPLPLPQPVPSAGLVSPKPGLDAEDRAKLAEAHRIGAQWVVLLVATAPEHTAEVTAQLEEFGGVIGTSSPGPGYLRVTMPTDHVEQAATLPTVTGVDIDQVISPDNPRPNG